MLRGSQTIGELRERASRLHEFSSLEEVEATLNSLVTREPEPLVTRLPRQAGQKEVRFAQMLAGEVAVDTVTETPSPRRSSTQQIDRVTNLEEDVSLLKHQVGQLQQQFEDFKKQFE
jgi:uncharacterized protein YceH (UPF0502 family)